MEHKDEVDDGENAQADESNNEKNDIEDPGWDQHKNLHKFHPHAHLDTIAFWFETNDHSLKFSKSWELEHVSDP